jgi:hypothetical protein
MIFNKHSELEGKHSFLSPSKGSWVNYDDDKVDTAFLRALNAARGSRLHALAATLIKERVKLPDTTATLNQYVNECIGFKLIPEQTLYATRHCFGTADAIGYDMKTNIIRVSDLKTGENPAHPLQLSIYVAIFCIEYQMRPFDFDAIELRIYQSDEVHLYEGDPVEISLIIDKIYAYTKAIDRLEEAIR